VVLWNAGYALPDEDAQAWDHGQLEFDEAG
jgi:hypothetical protein